MEIFNIFITSIGIIMMLVGFILCIVNMLDGAAPKLVLSFFFGLTIVGNILFVIPTTYFENLKNEYEHPLEQMNKRTDSILEKLDRLEKAVDNPEK